jgi:hypothetical protein
VRRVDAEWRRFRHTAEQLRQVVAEIDHKRTANGHHRTLEQIAIGVELIFLALGARRD